jgi:hypothetical protein
MILAQKVGKSSGALLVSRPWPLMTSPPTHSSPALLMSVCNSYLSSNRLYWPLLSSPLSTSLAKFWRSSRVSRSGFEMTSAAISPALPPGGSA